MAKRKHERALQFAVLPWRIGEGRRREVMLLTTRETRRWVIPKGWPMKGRKPAEVASREAYEEAGLIGQIVGKRPLGNFHYEKRLAKKAIICEVRVFLFRVERQVDDWPEKGNRECQWFEAKQAAALVEEGGLAEILDRFSGSHVRFVKPRRGRSRYARSHLPAALAKEAGGDRAGSRHRPLTAMDGAMQPSAQMFIDEVMANPVNAELLRRLPRLALNECFLTAGCLFQAVWNRISGHPAGSGVKDYDVFYFDGNDLSWEAEDSVIRRVQTLLADLGVNVEVRNQARVHHWYQQRFNASCPQLTSSRDGIDRFLSTCTCVGIEVATGALYAPNGLQELYEGILRMNPMNSQPILFRQKAQDYQLRWPWLRILDS